MKKVVKKWMAALLVIVMLIGVAPLDGFVNFKFSNLFRLKAEAAQAQTTGIISSKCGSGADPWYGETMGLNNNCGDNLKWTLDLDTGEMKIYGIGAMSNMWVFGSLTPWGEYQNYIKKIVISDGVTYIGSGAFWNCPNVESFYIPSSVKSVGGYAFMGKDINFGWNYKYSGCTIFYGGNEAQYKAAGLPTGRKDIRVKYNCDVSNYALEINNYTKGLISVMIKKDNELVPFEGASVYFILEKEEGKKSQLCELTTDENGFCKIPDLMNLTSNFNAISVYVKYETDDYILYGVSNGNTKIPYQSIIGNETTFILNRYCKKFNISVACTTSNKIQAKSIMEEFRQSFWSMTNGMAAIGKIEYFVYSNQSEYGCEDVYIRNIGYMCATRYGYYSFRGNPRSHIYADLIAPFQGWKANGNFIAHEAGHYFFGFWDEYLDGKENYFGFFNPRPDGAPDSFGIMESDYTTTRLSSESDYDYLKDIKGKDYIKDFDQSSPKYYTKQFFEEKQSCQTQLNVVIQAYLEKDRNEGRFSLGNIDFEPNSMGDFTFAPNDINDTFIYKQSTAAIGNSDVYLSANETTDRLAKISLSCVGGNIKLLTESNNSITHIFVQSQNDLNNVVEQDLIFENGTANIALDNVENNAYILTLAQKNVDDTYSKNTYTVSTFNSEISDGTWYSDFANVSADIESTNGVAKDLVILKDDSEYVNGEYKSIDGAFTLAKIDENAVISGEMIKTVSLNSDLDLATIGVFKYANGEYTRISQGFSDGEKTYAYVNFPYSGEGTYVLMAKPASTETISAVTNLTAVESEDTSGIYTVSFEDSLDMNDVAAYNLYYSQSPIADKEADGVYYKTFRPYSSSCKVNLYDDYGTWYFAVETVAKNGAKSPLSDSICIDFKPLDSDNDGLPDYWINRYNLDGVDNVANVDSDNDGLNNLQEYKNGTNPLNPDTDGDNVYDGVEVSQKLNPLTDKTDGKNDDYIHLYGQPDLKIKNVTFNDAGIEFEVENLTAGKAMRSSVYLSVNDEVVACWNENIGVNKTYKFIYESENANDISSLYISVDASKSTRDLDYSNNIFEYIPAKSISFASESYDVAKGSSIFPQIITEPENANEIYSWSISGNDSFNVDVSTGEVTTSDIGIATLTAKTLSGLTAQCNIYGVGFEGAEYSEFNSNLINNGTEVEILNYIGNDADITIPSTIGGLPVTSIKSIGRNNSVKTVTIPLSVKSISERAFNDVNYLSVINVDSENKYFSSKYGVLYNSDATELVRCPIAYEKDEIVIPNTVTSLESYSFLKCSNISKVVFGENSALNSIGDNAFCLNTSLTDITIPDSVVNIGAHSFRNCSSLESINIPSGVTAINPYTFYRCSDLKTIDIAGTITDIGDFVFYNCSALESIDLSENLEVISSWAFYGCSSLTSIKLPNKIVKINTYAFANCTGLTSIHIPENVKVIGSRAFSGCSGLKKISIATSNKVSATWIEAENTNVLSGNPKWDKNSSASGGYCVDYGKDLNFDFYVSVPGKFNLYEIAAYNDRAFSLYVDNEFYGTFSGEKTTIQGDEILDSFLITELVLSEGNHKIRFKDAKGDPPIYDYFKIEFIDGSKGVITAGENTGISIYNELNTISTYAFSNCKSLKDVYYSGTDEQWKTISISSGNEPLTNATFHFDHTHTFGEWEVDYASTCINEGKKHKACVDCGYVTYETIELADHTYELIPGKKATCLQSGLSDGGKCSVCGEILKKQDIIPATGHDYISIITEATCIMDGYIKHTCSVCGNSYTDSIIPAMGHTDSDKDGICDVCGEETEHSHPSDPSKDCTCICHKTGFMGFIYKIIRIFWKIFGINKICSCGQAHY